MEYFTSGIGPRQVSVSSWERADRIYFISADCEASCCWHFHKAASFLPPCLPSRPASRQQQEFLNYPINVEKNIEFGNLKLVVTWLDRLKSSNNVSILQQNISKMFTLIPFKVFLTEGKSVARLSSLRYFYPKLWTKLLAWLSRHSYYHHMPLWRHDDMTSWHHDIMT